MSAGGSIQEVSIANRRFAVSGEAESNRKIGGFENEFQSNGDGSGRVVKKRVPFKLDGLVLDIDDRAGGAEFLQEKADSTDLFPVTITYVTGETYAGNGQITGEIQTSSMNTTATVTLEGEAKLVIQ
jgi:hypothetical protein